MNMLGLKLQYKRVTERPLIPLSRKGILDISRRKKELQGDFAQRSEGYGATVSRTNKADEEELVSRVSL